MRERWRRLGGRVIHDAGVFRLREDRYEHRGRPVHPYYVLESRPWVNVVALTGAGEIVLVRQFRHGVREESLEVPGGLVDVGDADPAAAAARELVEETGYEAAAWEVMGTVASNPAILDNRTHTFLARGARRVADPAPDGHEDIVVELRPESEIEELLRSGAIDHSLSVCALAFYLLARDA